MIDKAKLREWRDWIKRLEEENLPEEERGSEMEAIPALIEALVEERARRLALEEGHRPDNPDVPHSERHFEGVMEMFYRPQARRELGLEE